MQKIDFTGKRALVVGGSRGIGRGVVQQLADCGADVIYASRNPADNKISAKYIQTNCSVEDDVRNLFNELDLIGDLDIVVNTSGINFTHKINEISLEEWNEVVSVNLTGAYLISKYTAERMKKQRCGKIVNVSSIAGHHRSLVSGLHYVSTKAGLIGLTKQLSFELAQYNVNVNVVCPSQTFSDMLLDSMSESELEKLQSTVPLQRIASVDDQVGPILFLCSDLSDYMTGAVLYVNGGQI